VECNRSDGVFGILLVHVLGLNSHMKFNHLALRITDRSSCHCRRNLSRKVGLRDEMRFE
jgi:hypothetical protein